MATDTKGVLISYRHDESAGYAGRIADRLIEHFGEHRVFHDLDAIEPGLDFVEQTSRATATWTSLCVSTPRVITSVFVGTDRGTFSSPQLASNIALRLPEPRWGGHHCDGPSAKKHKLLSSHAHLGPVVAMPPVRPTDHQQGTHIGP